MSPLLLGVLVGLAVLLRPGRPAPPRVPTHEPGHEPGHVAAPVPADARRPRGAGAAGRGRPSRTSRPASPAACSADVAETARLLATGLRGGASVPEALEVVAEHGPPAAAPTLRTVVAAHRWGRPAREAWATAGPAWSAVADALVAAEEAGLSPVRALVSAADRVDRSRRAAAVAALRRLEVLVVVPLGLAFLPGFVLTTVVPLVVVLAAGALAP